VITPNDDGTFTLNNPPEGVSADAWYWDQSLRDFGPGYVPPGFNELIIFDFTEGDGRKLMDSRLAEPYIIPENYPRVIFTVEESEALSIIGAEIGIYVAESRARWITQGGVDEEWDTYLGHLDALGLEEFVQIHRDALDRFRNS
jgi:putative aldouronate transport system substrate-binding protein